MNEWFQKRWSTIVTIGCLIIAAFVEAWQQAANSIPASIHFPRLQDGWNYVPLVLLIMAGLLWLYGKRTSVAPLRPQEPAVTPGIPALSALLGLDPKVEFNAKTFFALAYYSPVTAEVEKNIKLVAQKTSPNDREAFYARFIGVGLVAYVHDSTWYAIFGSQLKALAELSSRGLIPIADLKKHYDKAAVDFPRTFATYSFDQWIEYMKTRMLIATYPSQMVELSWNGKDFLKYLAHAGWNISIKVN